MPEESGSRQAGGYGGQVVLSAEAVFAEAACEEGAQGGDLGGAAGEEDGGDFGFADAGAGQDGGQAGFDFGDVAGDELFELAAGQAFVDVDAGAVECKGGFFVGGETRLGALDLLEEEEG